MLEFLQGVNRLIWGGPTLILILVAAVWLTIKTGFGQFRLFPRSIKYFFKKMRKDKCVTQGVSARQALCTALAATVGTGNLAGVAGAIAIGGPGAVFWMWICAFGGMILKFSEAALSVRFRSLNANGETVGGPMYMIQNGLGKRWHCLAYAYCFFGVVAALGVGNATQINTLIGSINGVLQNKGVVPSDKGNLIMGIGFAIFVAVLLLGGAKRIGEITEKLMPFAAVAYIALCSGVLCLRWHYVPGALSIIVKGAFTPAAVTGGMIGSVFQSMRVGVSRGVFTNEAGMGTAGIAHGAAQVEHPCEQGLMGIVEVFLDTIVICTMTALVILCSDIVIPYGNDCGVGLTANAFASVYGSWAQILLSLCVCCFAFATVLGWGLYGARCAQFLLGESAWIPFVILQFFTVILGAVLKTQIVWLAAEIVNGLMALPSLIALIYLTPELKHMIRQWKQND